jgi:chromatin remodeling complex protein RSC6
MPRETTATRNAAEKPSTTRPRKATPKDSLNNSKPVVKRVIRRVVKKAPEPVTPVDDTELETETPETPAEVIMTPGGTRKRREVTPETVDNAFIELCVYIEAEIGRQRDLKEKNGGRAPPGGSIKFLRSSLKRTKQLQGDVRRVARKKRATRQGNNNSGFLKKALITDAMADFLGVDHGTVMSRVDCTKRLHAYIIENDLQNPENRREIRPDNDLAKLLKHNKKSVDAGGHGPLFYYVMQKLIQQHFIKDTPAETPGV